MFYYIFKSPFCDDIITVQMNTVLINYQHSKISLRIDDISMVNRKTNRHHLKDNYLSIHNI